MRRISHTVLVAALLAALAGPTLAAQRRATRAAASAARVGPHVGVRFDGSDFLIGAQATFPVAARVAVYPSFDYYFVGGGVSNWALNLDLKFRPPTRYGFWYLGGGLNISRGGGNTETGLNLLTGFEGRRGPSTPYVEGKLTLDGGSAFQIVAGLSVRLR